MLPVGQHHAVGCQEPFKIALLGSNRKRKKQHRGDNGRVNKADCNNEGKNEDMNMNCDGLAIAYK